MHQGETCREVGFAGLHWGLTWCWESWFVAPKLPFSWTFMLSEFKLQTVNHCPSSVIDLNTILKSTTTSSTTTTPDAVFDKDGSWEFPILLYTGCCGKSVGFRFQDFPSCHDNCCWRWRNWFEWTNNKWIMLNLMTTYTSFYDIDNVCTDSYLFVWDVSVSMAYVNHCFFMSGNLFKTFVSSIKSTDSSWCKNIIELFTTTCC